MATTVIQPESTVSKLSKAALLLAAVGAINWGLIGLFNFNLVDAIFGGGSTEQTSTASRVVYALVGVAGLGALPMLRAILPFQHHPQQMHPSER